MGAIEHWIIDVAAFKANVWAVERENFRPGNALDALERAKVTKVKYEPADDCEGAVEALAELVRLKDGPRDDAYRAAKDTAWDEARRVLATVRGR